MKTKSGSEQERRKFSRVDMKVALTFQTLRRGEVSPKVKSCSDNFSAGGLAVESLTKLRRGQILMINLLIPQRGGSPAKEEKNDYSKGKGQNVAILSRVAYCTATNNRQYRLGVQFLDLDKADRKMFKKFLIACKLLPADSEIYC